MIGGMFYGSDTTVKNILFRWSDEPINVFEDEVISELVWDVFDLIQSLDYYKSRDTSKEAYLKEAYLKEAYLKDKAAFKKKWLDKSRGSVARKIVDGSIEDLRQELYEAFGLKGEE